MTLPNRRSPFIAVMLCLLVLPASRLKAQDTGAAPRADTKLLLKAALVLSPEFCATKTKKGTWGINQETFEIGKAACVELEPALRDAFSNVVSMKEAPAPESDAQVVLTPRFVDIGATQKMGAFSDRELVVLVEWTVRDKAGKTVWIETVQGSAKHHMGKSFTHGKNLKLIVADSVKDMATQSASKMAASQELRKVTAVKSTIEKN